ncbi:hypothetical protein GCM10028783_08970 [Modestobacter muralis]
MRSRHPRLAGLLLALHNDPATTANLRRGAIGEAKVAERLVRRCGDEVEFLFNRRLSARGRDGDIDVLAVAATGVHLVDVKHYQRAPVRVRRTGGLLTASKEQLLIRGRDYSRLLDSVQRQHEAVRPVLDRSPHGASVPIHLALCFVDADLPLIADRIGGVAVLGPRDAARRLRTPGPLGPAARRELVRHLARELPSA